MKPPGRLVRQCGFACAWPEFLRCLTSSAGGTRIAEAEAAPPAKKARQQEVSEPNTTPSHTLRHYRTRPQQPPGLTLTKPYLVLVWCSIGLYEEVPKPPDAHRTRPRRQVRRSVTLPSLASTEDREDAWMLGGTCYVGQLWGVAVFGVGAVWVY